MKCANRDTLNSWRVGGSPVNGSLNEKLVLARRKYKKAVEYAKRDYKAVNADKIWHSLNDKNSRKFWRLVNNVCKRQNTGVVSSLYANLFATTFKNNFVNSAKNVSGVKYIFPLVESVNKSELSFSVEEVETVLALNNSTALDSDDVNVLY